MTGGHVVVVEVIRCAWKVTFQVHDGEPVTWTVDLDRGSTRGHHCLLSSILFITHYRLNVLISN